MIPLYRCIQVLLLVLEVHLGQADPDYQQVKKKKKKLFYMLPGVWGKVMRGKLGHDKTFWIME